MKYKIGDKVKTVKNNMIQCNYPYYGTHIGNGKELEIIDISETTYHRKNKIDIKYELSDGYAKVWCDEKTIEWITSNKE